MSALLRGLAQLRAGELAAVGEAMSAGRLPPPYTGLGLARLVVVGADQAAAALHELWASGMASAHIALLLSSIAAERRQAESERQRIDLVATGPDTALGARDTAVVVRDLFLGAKASVLAVGFAVHGGRQVFSTLAERLDLDPTLDVVLCLDIARAPGNTSADAAILARFAEHFRTKEWPGKRLPRIYYDPRSLRAGPTGRTSLHAKCIVIDQARALVTSANFTEAAHQRNIELGLLVVMPDVAALIARHFEAMIAQGVLVRLPL
jgi:phosphatidylserine/phosphatidylglycerophosphate/cardiolipin synthase-like enzyme